jgi:hypothetical protein
MEKQQLISFVKKSHKKYPNNSKPRDIYREIQSDQLIRPAFGKIITGNDILMYCYMIPKYKEGVDLDKLYDLLKYYLTAFKVIYFEKKHPRKECPNCYGNGIEDCNVCGGDGKNDDTTNCDDCEGEGTFECHNCGGSGEYDAYDEVKIEELKYVTYNPKIVDRLENMEEGEIIDYDDFHNIIKNDGTILIYSEEDYGDFSDYKNIEEDNYIFDSEIRNPKFQIGSLGRVSIRI